MGREFGGAGQKESLSVGGVKFLWSIPLELEQRELKASCWLRCSHPWEIRTSYFHVDLLCLGSADGL
jgi:hypothetical protein